MSSCFVFFFFFFCLHDRLPPPPWPTKCTHTYTHTHAPAHRKPRLSPTRTRKCSAKPRKMLLDAPPPDSGGIKEIANTIPPYLLITCHTHTTPRTPLCIRLLCSPPPPTKTCLRSRIRRARWHIQPKREGADDLPISFPSPPPPPAHSFPRTYTHTPLCVLPSPPHDKRRSHNPHTSRRGGGTKPKPSNNRWPTTKKGKKSSKTSPRCKAKKIYETAKESQTSKGAVLPHPPTRVCCIVNKTANK